MNPEEDDVMAMISSMCGDDNMYSFLPLFPDSLNSREFPEAIGDQNSDSTTDGAEHSDDSLSSGHNPRKRKCPGPSNPDAVLVDQATDEKLRQLNIDPNSKEGKKERRRIRNRLSAQMHRERKQAYIETLEYEVQLRDQKIVSLQEQLAASVAECEKLRAAVAASAAASIQIIQPVQSVQYPREDVAIPAVRRSRSMTAVTSTEGSDSEGSVEGHWSCTGSDLEQDVGSANTDSPIELTSSAEAAVSALPPLPLFSTLPTSENTHSVPAPPPSSLNQFKGSLSMFSIVLLLGISFFSGSFMSSSPVYPLSLTAPPPRPAADSRLFLSPDRRAVLDRPHPAHAGGRVLLALPSDTDDGTHSSSSSSVDMGLIGGGAEDVDNSKAVGKWTPLRLTAPVHHWSSSGDFSPSRIRHDGEYFNEEEKISQRSATRPPQIWKYQNHVTTIFPADLDALATNDSNASETSAQSSKKYLRANPDVHSYPSASGETRGSAVYGSRDVATYYNLVSPSLGSAMSQVLITEGRVLLDPALAARASGSAPPSAEEKGVIPSSWNRGHSGDSNAASTGSGDDATATLSPSNQQLLTMLVPASAVQWGGSKWVDGDSPDNSDVVMQHLLRNLNLTDVLKTENADGSESIDLSSLWVEIGCSVSKARIVQDVSVLDGRTI